MSSDSCQRMVGKFIQLSEGGVVSGHASMNVRVAHSSRWRTNLLSVLVLGATLRGSSAWSQSTRVLQEALCASCVSIVPVLNLGEDAGLGALGAGRGLVQLRDGSFVHADGRGGALVKFSSAGVPLQRIGREGSGPLEFRRIDWLMRDGADSLLVFDLENGRAVTISPSGRQSRQFQMAYPVTSASFLPNGNIVANVHFDDSRLTRMPVHVLDRRSGAVLASFGHDSNRVYDAREAWAGWRELTVDPRGTIWTVRRNDYRLEASDARGKRLQSLERRVKWFAPYTVRSRLSPDDAPQPHVERVHADSFGRLWVFIAVPAHDWRKHIVARAATPGILPGYEPVSLSGIYDTIIEVIDVPSATVLASHRISDYGWGMVSDSLMYSDAQAADGVPRYRLWKVGFTRGSTSGRR